MEKNKTTRKSRRLISYEISQLLYIISIFLTIVIICQISARL